MSKEAMKRVLEALERYQVKRQDFDRFADEITALREALAEQDDPDLQDKDPEFVEQHYKQVVEGVRKVFDAKRKQSAQQEPVAFLANGTRFKISYDSRQSGGQIHGIPPELGGRWVAFVAADDDCHLKLTSPPAQRTWVELTKGEIESWNLPENATLVEIAWFIEGKIKEKNT